MLQLDHAQLVGKGSSRYCYVHPEDETKCVKVVYTRRDDIASEELSYYRKFMRRDVSWEMVARTYGEVDTSRGEGMVFELPRDFDGSISRTLEHYLLHGGVSLEKLALALLWLKKFLIRERIVVRELKADNVVFQRPAGEPGLMVLIDGVGNNEFLPLANFSRLFLRRTIRRKWTKFVNTLTEYYPQCRRAEELQRLLLR